MIAMSETTHSMALLLGINDSTIEWHRAKLMRNLGIFDVAGLTREAILRGLITLCCDT